MPEVLPMIGCEQPPEWHPEGDVYTHTRIMLEMLAPDAPLELCLAVLLHDIAKPPCRTFDDESGRIRFNGHDAMGAEMADTILRRLRYPNDTIAAVVPMVARHMQFMNVQKMRVAKLKRFMAEPTFHAGNGAPPRRLRVVQRLHRQLRIPPSQGRGVRRRAADPAAAGHRPRLDPTRPARPARASRKSSKPSKPSNSKDESLTASPPSTTSRRLAAETSA